MMADSLNKMTDTQPHKADSSPTTVSVHPETHHPTKLWSKMKVKSTVTEVAPISFDTPKPDGHTRFVCISDTHSLTDKMPPLPDGDVLIHAGDFTNQGFPTEVEKFNEWLGTVPFKHKIVIAGNHELSFDPVTISTWRIFDKFDKSELEDIHLKLTNCVYLKDDETNVLGFRIYGSPWQPEFFDWGFNLPRGQPMLDVWNQIPEGIDVLITHGPPIGHGDQTSSEERAGCVELLNTIQKRVKPKYHVFGHIHEGYGITTDGYTTYINASICTLGYKPINKPVIFDLPNPV